jgi:cytochrome d ubiquinol oxidase subunit II
MQNHTFSGGHWDWLTLFSMVCGVGVVSAYALLGSTWLLRKTEGELHRWARRRSGWNLFVVLGFIAVVSVYTPLAYPAIAERWFGHQHWIGLAPVPIATTVVGFSLWRELHQGSDLAPFAYAIALFLLGYLGIAISLWPNLLPPDLSIWDAAAPPQSQKFVLVALAITLPMILIYTAYAYSVFWGKVTDRDGYSSH